jgi:hypothetical protein
MAVTSNAPLPRAPISETTEDPTTGDKRQTLTQPFSVWFRDLRADVDAAPIAVPDGVVSVPGGNAAVITTKITTPSVSGLYSFSYYSEVTSADGASSLTPVLTWTSHGAARSHTFSVMSGASAATTASEDYLFYADRDVDVNYALTYPAGAMIYNFYAVLASVAGVS